MNYTNNTEYRQCLRSFFNMDLNKCSQNIQQHWDEETIDEMYYDDSAVSIGLDSIYKKTKDHPLFQQIYQLAAAKMISLNTEIGLAVCISYEYFKWFFDCLEVFDKNPAGFNESSSEYQVILGKLT